MEVNYNKSKSIFEKLINGCAINKYKIGNDGAQKEDPLFTELFTCINDYKQQYKMGGFELIEGRDFFYIRDRDPNQIKTDLSKRIQVLLLILGRHITSTYSYEKLVAPHGGILEDEISELDNNDEVQEILRAVKIDSMLKGVKANLIDKGIAQYNNSGKIILTQAGDSFFKIIFEEYSASSL